MNGRDLIIYILENHLEDTDMFVDGVFVGFIPVRQVAAKVGVGEATIRVWVELGTLKGVTINDQLYILPTKELDTILKSKGVKNNE